MIDNLSNMIFSFIFTTYTLIMMCHFMTKTEYVHLLSNHHGSGLRPFREIAGLVSRIIMLFLILVGNFIVKSCFLDNYVGGSMHILSLNSYSSNALLV